MIRSDAFETVDADGPGLIRAVDPVSPKYMVRASSGLPEPPPSRGADRVFRPAASRLARDSLHSRAGEAHAN